MLFVVVIGDGGGGGGGGGWGEIARETNVLAEVKEAKAVDEAASFRGD